MMFGWIWRALRTGIVTTRYPSEREPQSPGVRNWLVVDSQQITLPKAERAARVCPTGAVAVNDNTMRLDLGRCIQCGRCATASDGAFRFASDYELGVRRTADLITTVELP